MQLVLKSNGNTSPFVAWLKGFKDINSILLIEVDLVAHKFVAKCFPETRDIVKYSEISFEQAGYELNSLLENDEDILVNGTLPTNLIPEYENDARIKVGVYKILPKYIDVMNMYSDVDHTMKIRYDVSNNVKYIKATSPKKEWQGELVTLSSKTLSMNVKCSQLTEFFDFLPDSTVNMICNLDTPVSFMVLPETISNLDKVSQLFVSEKSKANVELYVKKDGDVFALYAYDATEKSYDYLLGYVTDTTISVADDVRISIPRENFINAAKSLKENMTITMSQNMPNRILVETPNSKSIISAVLNVK